jgi:glycosyltransferase involved in cell wall biosynthesis
VVTTGRRPHVLVLVQNLPVPFDRRVWQEARALRDGGYRVTVVCPRTRQFPAGREELEGISIRRYRPLLEGGSVPGWLTEYAVALTGMTWHAWRVAARHRVDVVHACNPPDLLFLVGLPMVLLRGARFVFDHHDVCPELMVAKGHAPDGRAVRLLAGLERLTFGSAVVSIATNESYRDVALTRGGMAAEDVFVVRSGPAGGFDPVSPDPRLRAGRRHLVGYVGVMGVQEGIGHLVEAARIIVRDLGRDDVTFALAGSGPETARLRARVEELGLADHVRFLGRIPDDELITLLSTADVCVNPDEANALNDMSTMNKVLEYMALGRPIVQYDLHEGRVSAGPSSLYAERNEPAALARDICRLLDDPALRERMGAAGRERFVGELSWARQVPRLLAAYDRALAKRPRDIGLFSRRWWRRPHGPVPARPVGPAPVPPAIPRPADPVDAAPAAVGA